MKWELVRLGDIVELSNGINFDKSSYQKGIKLINVSNFGNRFTPDYNELLEIKSSCVRESYILKDGDIIFVRSNGNKELVGRCMLIKHPPLPVTYSGFCIRARIIDKQQFDETFLTYHFKSILFRRSMSGTSVGANIQNLSQSRLSNYQFKLPDITIQRKIAKILSAYDNLIENNQKQIKLLEEAAQLLYKEWFVDLRFPGYENVPIVDGVPKGWNKSLLKEISEFKRGKTITKNSVNNGSIPVVAGGLEPAYYHNKANTTAPVITVSGSGANAGFTKLYYNDVWASDCSFVDSNNTEYIYFVYCFLKNNKDRIDNLQKGSAQPHVYAKDINALSFNLPNTEILNMFSEIIEPYFALIGKLQKQIRAAEQARDRLLPKLMSGELEV